MNSLSTGPHLFWAAPIGRQLLLRAWDLVCAIELGAHGMLTKFARPYPFLFPVSRSKSVLLMNSLDPAE